MNSLCRFRSPSTPRRRRTEDRPRRASHGVRRGTFQHALIAVVLVASAASPALAGYSPRKLHVGVPFDLGVIESHTPVAFPSPSTFAPIVGIGISDAGDCYFWRADGVYTRGLPENWGEMLEDYSLPEGAGKDASDIVTMAVGEYDGAPNRVFTFYTDRTFSIGTYQNLGAVEDPMSFSLPDRADGEARNMGEVVGIGANPGGQFFAFFSDGMVSVGSLVNVGGEPEFDWEEPFEYKLPSTVRVGQVIDLAVYVDHVTVTWTQDLERGNGHQNLRDAVDALAMDALQRCRLPGLSLAVSKNGRLVHEKGYGYRNFTTGTRMNRTSRGQIGSVSKVIAAWAAMHLQQTRSEVFDVSRKVYELLPPTYEDYQKRGVARHQPIVAKAIHPDGTFYTWDHSGMVTTGTAIFPDTDPDGPQDYASSLPVINDEGDRFTPDDIRAIAIDDLGQCWIWYDDRTYSCGTPTDFEAHEPRDEDVKVALPSHYDDVVGEWFPLSMDQVVGIDYGSDGSFHVWYETGYYSAGTESDFAADKPYVENPLGCDDGDFGIFSDLYNVRAIGIDKSYDSGLRVYAFHANYEDPFGSDQWARVYENDKCVESIQYSVSPVSWDSDKDWLDWYGQIRVDHLLSHSSGLATSGAVDPARWFFHGLSYDSLTYGDVHRYMLASGKLAFAPGSDYKYSNHGIGLVGHIISTITGQSFRDYAVENIIGDLDLGSVADGLTSSDMWRHTFVDGVPVAIEENLQHDLGLATGGWKASAGDLVRLMLRTDGDSTHKDILDDGIITIMETQPHPGSTYALGWEGSSDGTVAKGGSKTGARAFMIKYPEGKFGGDSAMITVALCANADLDRDQLDLLCQRIAIAADRAAIGKSYDLY